MGFFFKQKTEYEMRISDGSSDVCSSDLTVKLAGPRCARRERHRDCRGDAVPGDCRHQCAREAGLAAAARCRNDEETALTHARCPSPIRFLRLQDERCRHQDRLAATITLRLVQIGRASWRERGCHDGLIWVCGGSLKKKKNKKI